MRRHSAFKIIPRVTHGSWMVKQAVGQNTPVLLGRKITTKYFRCARDATCMHKERSAVIFASLGWH